MSVVATITSNLSVVETLAAAALASAKNNDLTWDALNETIVLNAGSTPPATLVAAFEIALIAGAATIDLRALQTGLGTTIDGNGLKVRAIKIKNKTGNANPITVTFGAANGYLLFGAAWKLILSPDQTFQAYLKDAAPAIDATHKTIDLAGTGTQVLQVIILLG